MTSIERGYCPYCVEMENAERIGSFDSFSNGLGITKVSINIAFLTMER